MFPVEKTEQDDVCDLQKQENILPGKLLLATVSIDVLTTITHCHLIKLALSS